MTPEGIDQNPAYYEFMIEANFRSTYVADIPDHIVRRSTRRYGLKDINTDVATAWNLLVNSTYSQDLSVQDPTGIPHLPGSTSQFLNDRYTPSPTLCLTFNAWKSLLAAAPAIDSTLVTYRYDLINLGRELLAQLSTPVSQNFSDAFSAATLDANLLTKTGNLYLDLLNDVDTLVATETAFLLGPVIEQARLWGANSSDCGTLEIPTMNCPDFYEYNVRTQLTTWNPVPMNATKIPGGPIDYASKHWSGLISDYYYVRAAKVLAQALSDASKGQALNATAIEIMEADHAYTFQHTVKSYPVTPVGDARQVSAAMLTKYSPYYSVC
jgi:alpha-N-acetylglucosaminidase